MRFIRHTLMYLLIKLPMQLLGMVVLAVYLPFHGSSEQLPRLLRWFDNSGTYLNNNVYEPYVTDGLSGGPSYRAQWKKPEGFLARYTWLACRNPVNYFQVFVLGYGPKKGDTYTVSNYQNNSQLGPLLDSKGYNNYLIETSSGVWERSYLRPMGLGLALNLRFGYKLVHDDGISQCTSKNPAQWTYNIGLRKAK